MGEVKAGAGPTDLNEGLTERGAATEKAFSFCWMSQLMLNIELDAKWISCFQTGSVCRSPSSSHLISSNISGFSAKRNVSTWTWTFCSHISVHGASSTSRVHEGWGWSGRSQSFTLDSGVPPETKLNHHWLSDKTTWWDVRSSAQVKHTIPLTGTCSGGEKKITTGGKWQKAFACSTLHLWGRNKTILVGYLSVGSAEPSACGTNSSAAHNADSAPDYRGDSRAFIKIIHMTATSR